MQTKSRVFVCPFGTFPNRIAAAKVAEANGMRNAFVKFSRLCEIDPANYHYETKAANKITSNPTKKKSEAKSNNGLLVNVTLIDGSEVSWEEFSKWSEIRQRANLIPISNKTKHKQSIAAVNRWQNEEYRNKLSHAHTGKFHTDETKARISALNGTAVITPNGEFPSIRSAARDYKVSDTLMRTWIWKTKTDEFYLKKI